MMSDDFIIADMRVDNNDQWFVYAWVSLAGRNRLVEFKIDTGCNALVLSHKTLRKLGVNITDLSRLTDTIGIQASGEKHDYKKLGKTSLFLNKTTQICETISVCHATRETHDLLGTRVLKQFCRVNFILDEENFMQLKKRNT